MRALRVVIADDEPLAVRLLRSYCERTPGVEVAGAYTDPARAMTHIEAGGVDLAVLDIQMPGLTGMDIARRLADSAVQVIFVTAYADYAVDGFRVHALDYLLKPVSYEDFSAALERARRALPAPTHITVTADYRRHRIPLGDIALISGLGDYVKIHLTDGRRILTQISIKQLSATLPPDSFIRVHRSHIVGTAHIESYDRATLSLRGLGSVRVGDTYRPALDALLDRH